MTEYKSQLLTTDFEQNKRWTFKSFVFTVNLILILFGYPIYISILSAIIPIDSVENSWIFTVPIKIVCLMISVWTIFLGSTKNKKWSVFLWAFAFFYILYSFRFFIDIFFYRPSSNIAFKFINMSINKFIQQAFGYYVWTFTCIISIYRTWKQIDYKKTLNLILIFGNIAILVAIYGMSKNYIAFVGIDAEERYNATSMLNTISLGHFAVSIVILSIYKFFKTPSVFFKIINISFSVLALLLALRSGSRGPIVAFIFVVIFWIASYYKNIVLSFGIFSLLSLIIFATRWTLLGFIQKISPVLYYRLEATLEWGESSDRVYLLKMFFDEIIKNPILGVQCDVFGYAHNIIVDSFMMFGVIGGWILPVIFITCIYTSYKILMNKNLFHWICLLFLQYFIAGMFSGCWGGNAPLQCLLILILLYANETRNSNLLAPSK